MSRSVSMVSLCLLLGVLVVMMASVEAAPHEKRQILGAILDGLLDNDRYHHRRHHHDEHQHHHDEYYDDGDGYGGHGRNYGGRHNQHHHHSHEVY
ncbi:transcription factor MafAa-like [Daphnia pulicaria]|uniref:transcription factor MafAa-like n=1 Tax=Daphnia pulicaria TaxID=35523 RepID=UPI001EEAB81A|nr:transcription factor MafAa-like [Daphnia pulicaria]